MNYFRAQGKGHTLIEMQNHTSKDGANEGGTEGVCCCDSIDGLLNNTVMDAMNDDDEVVVIRGQEIAEIYDGYRVYPTEIIARMTVAEFTRLAETGAAYDYEDWS